MPDEAAEMRERAMNGLARKAQIAKFVAGLNGDAAVVLATDVDGADPVEWAAKVGEIAAGFDSVPGGPEGIACVPMGTSEAWLLTDPTAWSALGAMDFDELPGHPEETWGRPHEPSSNHPKNVFRRMCAANNIEDNSETRRQIAVESDFAWLREECPIAFPPFADQMAVV